MMGTKTIYNKMFFKMFYVYSLLNVIKSPIIAHLHLFWTCLKVKV